VGSHTSRPLCGGLTSDKSVSAVGIAITTQPHNPDCVSKWATPIPPDGAPLLPRLAMPIRLMVLHSSIEPNHVTGAPRFLTRYHHLGGFDKGPFQKSIAFSSCTSLRVCPPLELMCATRPA
jgi:hypothetical protein